MILLAIVWAVAIVLILRMAAFLKRCDQRSAGIEAVREAERVIRQARCRR